MYQRYFIIDPLTKKLVRNKGALPQYIIENHHKPIVSSDTWEKAQSIIRERSEIYTKGEKVKYSKDQIKNKSFEGGSCSSSVGHIRDVYKSKELLY